MDNIPQEEDITPEEIRGWLEFGCWTTLALWPFLYWVNGPAVSDDQFVVRTALIVIAFVGGTSLRTYKIMKNKAAKKDQENVSG